MKPPLTYKAQKGGNYILMEAKLSKPRFAGIYFHLLRRRYQFTHDTSELLYIKGKQCAEKQYKSFERAKAVLMEGLE